MNFDQWQQWAHTGTNLPTWAAALCAAGGAAAGWRIPHPATVLHEAGHALIGMAVGRRITGIRVHSDTSGSTSSLTYGPARFRDLLVVCAGYPAPAAAAYGLAAAWTAGWAGAGLIGLALLLALVLLLGRSVVALLVTVAGLAALAGSVWLPPIGRETACVIAAAWFTAGAVHAVRHAWLVWREPESGSDAQQARQLSGVPQVVWLVLFTAALAAAPVFAVAAMV